MLFRSMVGTIEARKNHIVALRAWQTLLERLDPADVPDLVCIGRLGWHADEFLREYVTTQGLGGRVSVLSTSVPDAELARFYAAADVFAMPCRSRYAGFEIEGWGSVFIEAAACDRPVVVGDSGGAREALVDGETGTLVRGGDVEQVATAVADLLADPERARSMGKAGRARVESYFTWRRVASQLAGWLREAAA